MTNDVDVIVREVGLRDGLQNVKDFMATAAKQAWCAAEAAAGVREIEVCSFVPPRLIPQFSDAAEVVRAALALPGLRVAALVPNLKGAELAIAAGVHQINLVISVSASHSLANVRRRPEESLDDLGRIVAARDATAAGRRPALAVGLATSFGCSMEGRVSPEAVRRLAGLVAAAGADEIALADTVGYAAPRQVRALFTDVARDVAPLPLAAHFHNTRGMGCANAAAALDAGVRRFDAALGGLGGCPYAPGATGNVVTDDLVFMFEAMGLRTGIDLERLLAVRDIVRRALPAVDLYGELARAGLPKGFEPATRVAGRA